MGWMYFRKEGEVSCWPVVVFFVETVERDILEGVLSRCDRLRRPIGRQVALGKLSGERWWRTLCVRERSRSSLIARKRTERFWSG